jgi:prophage regulatory protein
MLPNTILRLSTVKTATGLSRATIYRRIRQGTFPAPVSLGGRAVGWLESEIGGWIQSRATASGRTANCAPGPHSAY